MGMLQRFGDIMASNINALLDKCEDPSKMVDQYLRQAKEDQAAVKAETATIMATEAEAKRKLDKIQKEVADYDTAIRNAISKGNDEDAKKLLERKNALQSQVTAAQQVYDTAHTNSVHMQEMYNKLTNDIAELNQRRETVKSQMSMAKAQERINRTNDKFSGRNVNDAFSRMEERSQQALDKAVAKANLDAVGTTDPTGDLKDQYLSQGSGTLDDQLAAIKAEMGM